MVILGGGARPVHQLGHPRKALNFRAAEPGSVDEYVVQDRHQPNPHIVSRTKARAFFECADKSVMHQILGIDAAACERPRIATKAIKLADDIRTELLSDHF